MKTYKVYVLTLERNNGASFYQKMFLVSLILALLLASLPVTSALAAPAGSQDLPADTNSEEEWSSKLRHLQAEGIWYNRIRLNPADFDRPSDLAQAHYYLEQYGIALRQANTVLMNHTGFDIKGNLLHPIQADQTVHDLAMYLQMMRGFREKMNEVPRGK